MPAFVWPSRASWRNTSAVLVAPSASKSPTTRMREPRSTCPASNSVAGPMPSSVETGNRARSSSDRSGWQTPRDAYTRRSTGWRPAGSAAIAPSGLRRSCGGWGRGRSRILIAGHHSGGPRPGLAILYGNEMQFTRENADEANAILSCTDREVRLPGRSIAGSVIVTRDAVIEDWRPPEVEALAIADFAALLSLRPEVVLLGTGERQRLPGPALYAEFAERGIGLEVMDNGAACRTYNLLLGEFRDVAVALIL